MTSISQHLRNYAELGRISNLPTVLTNVLVGIAVGAVSAQVGIEQWNWSRVAGVMIAIVCFYTAGMALNDVMDVEVDRVERPNRPIPSGRVSRETASVFVAALFVIGLSILAFTNLQALAAGACLVAGIILYDVLHSRIAGAVLLMGLCRALVYLTAAASMAWPLNWNIIGVLAGALLLYIVMLTIISRSENQKQLDFRRWLAFALPLIAIAPVAFLPIGTMALVLGWMFVVVAWLLRAAAFVFQSPPRTKNAVMAWLAGICLVDGLYLSLLNQPMLAVIAGACFIITVLGQRRILGT